MVSVIPLQKLGFDNVILHSVTAIVYIVLYLSVPSNTIKIRMQIVSTTVSLFSDTSKLA